VAGLKLKGTFHLLVSVGDGNLLMYNINVRNKNTQALNIVQSHNLNISDTCFENKAKLRYLEMTVIN
jgi:hypothetical protein